MELYDRDFEDDRKTKEFQVWKARALRTTTERTNWHWRLLFRSCQKLNIHRQMGEHLSFGNAQRWMDERADFKCAFVPPKTPIQDRLPADIVREIDRHLAAKKLSHALRGIRREIQWSQEMMLRGIQADVVVPILFTPMSKALHCQQYERCLAGMIPTPAIPDMKAKHLRQMFILVKLLAQELGCRFLEEGREHRTLLLRKPGEVDQKLPSFLKRNREFCEFRGFKKGKRRLCDALDLPVKGKFTDVRLRQCFDEADACKKFWENLARRDTMRLARLPGGGCGRITMCKGSDLTEEQKKSIDNFLFSREAPSAGTRAARKKTKRRRGERD